MPQHNRYVIKEKQPWLPAKFRTNHSFQNGKQLRGDKT